MATWTCDSCGATGVVPEGSTSDEVLCDTCGEPVLPDDPSPSRWTAGLAEQRYAVRPRPAPPPVPADAVVT